MEKYALPPLSAKAPILGAYHISGVNKDFLKIQTEYN